MRRRGPADLTWPSGELAEETRALIAPPFEAVGEALAAGTTAIEACWMVGRALAEVGSSLGESLEGLRATTRLVAGRDPRFDETHALSLAWSESVLGYLHGLSCADPLTGLSTHAHIRERISELYRHALLDSTGTDLAAGVDRTHALVVTYAGQVRDAICAARRLTLLGQAARSVFSGTETIGQVGHAKVVVIAPRNDALAGQVALLRRMVDQHAERVWIEGLPRTDASAACLLDELARC